MTKPALISLVFHAVFVLIFILGLPFFGRQYLAPRPKFTVDLVFEGAQNPNGNGLVQNNTEALGKVETTPVPPTPNLPPAPVEKPVQLPPPAPPPEASKEPAKIVPPAPEKPAPPTPAKPPETKVPSRQDLLRQLEKAVNKEPAKTKADAKEKPQEKAVKPPAPDTKAQKQPDQLAELMQAMDRTKTTATKRDKKKPNTQAASNGAVNNSNNIANPAASSALGIIDLDAVRRVVEPCWRVDAGMLNASQLQVDLRLTINREGVVEKAEIVDTNRYQNDRYYRAAANAARRAVEDPNCHALPLPRDRYYDWHVSVFSFDPKDIGR